MSGCWDDQDPLVTGVEFTEQPFYYTTVGANPSLVSRPIVARDHPYPDLVKAPRKTVTVCTLVMPRQQYHFNRAISSIKLATAESDLASMFEGFAAIYQLHQHTQRSFTSFTRGFCVQIFESQRKNREQSIQQMLVDFAKETGLKLSFWDFDEDTQSLWQTTVVDPEGDAAGQDRRLIRPLGVPSCHPAFIMSEDNAVFKCLRDVWNLLQKVRLSTTSNAVLDLHPVCVGYAKSSMRKPSSGHARAITSWPLGVAAPSSLKLCQAFVTRYWWLTKHKELEGSDP